MPLYRTVSDRGLWKKYKDQKPKHFHKSNYLELEKEKPQVTYTQLDLGDNYRTYNHRQSNPNVKASVSDLSHGEGSGTFERRRLTNHERGRSLSTTKSAPVTPRALSPSRSRYQRMNRDGFHYEDVIRPPSSTLTMNSAASGFIYRTYADIMSQQGDPMTSPSGYPDSESNYSLDSRSLAAYSAASSTMGRDNWNTGYRYPYAAEPVRQSVGKLGYLAQLHNPDRPNPFSGPLSPDAENVVQMFLLNHKLGQMSTVSQQILPGRIADLDSPVGPISPNQNGFPLSSSSMSSKLSVNEDEEKNFSKTRTVIAQLKKDFLNAPPPAPVSPSKKTNKYLKPENRWKGPPPPLPSTEETPSDQPPDKMPFAEDTVGSFQAPQILHAEVVTLTKDATSESGSDDDDDDDSSTIRAPTRFGEDTPRLMPYSADTSSTVTPQFQSLSVPDDYLQELRRQHQLEQQQLEREFELQREKLLREQEDIKKRYSVSNLAQLEPSKPDIVQSHDVPDQSILTMRKLSMSKPTDLDEMFQMQADEEEEMNDVVTELRKTKSSKSILIRKDQTPDDVFKNDPWFQKNLNFSSPDNPNIDLSFETTQEIDIDALLGYAEDPPVEVTPRDGTDSPVVKKIEDIVWPTTIPDLNPRPLEPVPIQTKSGIKAKNSFFKFGSSSSEKSSGKVKKKIPQVQDNNLFYTPKVNGDKEMSQIETENPKDSKSKKKNSLSGIFQKPNWKTSKTKVKEPLETGSRIGDQNPVDVSHLLDDDFFIEEYSFPRTDNFPENEHTKILSDDFEVFSLTDNSFQNGLDESILQNNTKISTASNQDETSYDLNQEKSTLQNNTKILTASSHDEANYDLDGKNPDDDLTFKKSDDGLFTIENPVVGGLQAFKNPVDDLQAIKNPVDGLLITKNPEDEFIPDQSLHVESQQKLVDEEVKKFLEGQAVPVVGPLSMPVERDEPKATGPAKKKSNGFSSFFSSSQIQSRPKDVAVVSAPKNQPPVTVETSSAKPTSNHKGFTSLFVKRQKSSSRSRPVSIHQDVDDHHEEVKPLQDRRQRSKLSSIFASKRGPRAKSLTNITDKHTQVVEAKQHIPASGSLTHLQHEVESQSGMNRNPDKVIFAHPQPIPFQDITNERVKHRPLGKSIHEVEPQQQGSGTNRQMGRRSGRFRKSADDSQGFLDISQQLSSSSLHSNHTAVQGVMRDLFAESVSRKPSYQQSHNPKLGTFILDDSTTSSGFPDLDYERAMMGNALNDRSKQNEKVRNK